MKPGHPLTASARREFLLRMRVPIFAFVTLMLFLLAIVLLGALDPSRTASWIEAGLTICMALTVLLFSMEVRTDAPILRFFSGLGFAWVCILFSMTLLDYLTR